MRDRSVLAGSLAAGLLASACCIGPAVLAVVGLGSLGLAASLATLRPWFLVFTAGFLAIGFYLAYRSRRTEVCAPGEACATPARRSRQRLALWLVTVLAGTLASYPMWGARLLTPHATASSGEPERAVVVLDVQGMTCEACAAEIGRALHRVPGVVRADVSFERRRAEVALASPHPKIEPLISAVERAGYRATAAGQ